MARLLTVLGLALVTAGIACAFVALRRPIARHDGRPLWPWGQRQWTLIRLTTGRAVARLLRRPKQVVEVSGTTSMSTTGTAVITATVSSTPFQQTPQPRRRSAS
jgi:hypothetical protein